MDEVVDVQEKVTLSVDDIALVFQILQAVSQRGAVRAEEMSAVGNLYNKIFEFLKQEGVITQNEQQNQQS